MHRLGNSRIEKNEIESVCQELANFSSGTHYTQTF